MQSVRSNNESVLCLINSHRTHGTDTHRRRRHCTTVVQPVDTGAVDVLQRGAGIDFAAGGERGRKLQCNIASHILKVPDMSSDHPHVTVSAVCFASDRSHSL